MKKLLVLAALSLLILPSAALADTITFNGVTSIEDVSGAPVTQIQGFFAGIDTALVSVGTGDTSLFQQSFNRVGQNGYVATNFTYTFTAAQLTILANYIANGNNFAFGFDPDCHFWNNGIVFTITPSGNEPVAEPATLALLGSGLLSTGFYLRRRRKARTKTEK